MTVLLIAVWVAGVTSLFGTRYVIRFFQRLGRGQPILGKEDRGPEHQHKEGTPTMGGIAIVGAAFIGWLVPHASRGLPFSDQALAVWFAVFVLAGIGFLDDFIKVRRARNRGIFWKSKGWITLGVCMALVALLLLVVDDFPTTISFTRATWPGWELPKVLFVLWGGFIVFATANAVNVTDGLDGLAAGTSLMGFAAFTLIAFWGFRNQEVYPDLVNPLDLAVLAAAFAGALAGFLWWNAAPAKVFMGDVGALGIGAALGMLALTTNTALLLPIIAGVQVIEILSVAIQMTSFKLFHKRVFRLSPIHHHFELVGWPETRIIIRFWLISGLFVGTAVGIYYADWYRLAQDLGLIP
jgi:phospho-N-acetylmuramoyl-pentapeptide-transferase